MSPQGHYHIESKARDANLVCESYEEGVSTISNHLHTKHRRVLLKSEVFPDISLSDSDTV